jgi:hypothetical protein
MDLADVAGILGIAMVLEKDLFAALSLCSYATTFALAVFWPVPLDSTICAYVQMYLFILYKS